jgi:hypothetical protein
MKFLNNYEGDFKHVRIIYSNLEKIGSGLSYGHPGLGQSLAMAEALAMISFSGHGKI